MLRVYWDSDCFLGWLQSEADKQAACGQVIAECEVGNIKIMTSALTIAEVLMLRGHDKIRSDRATLVKDFFRQPYISVRGLTRIVAEQAREIVWAYGIAPKDAIHVASAIAAEVTTLHTFDANLIKKSGRIGLATLTIENPSVPAPRLDLPGGGGLKKR